MIRIANTNIEIGDILKRLHTIENILFSMVDVIDLARNYEVRLKKLEENIIEGKHKMSNDNQVEQQNLIKTALVEKSFRYYNDLVNFIKGLPVDQQNFYLTLQNLAREILWVKEVLTLSTITLGDPEDLNKKSDGSQESCVTPDNLTEESEAKSA